LALDRNRFPEGVPVAWLAGWLANYIFILLIFHRLTKYFFKESKSNLIERSGQGDAGGLRQIINAI